MKKLISLIVIIILLGCRREDNPPQINHTWIEDIEFLQRELPQKHVNLFTNITEQEFNAEVERLIDSVPNLKENEIICGLMKIFAKIGDSHTFINDENNSLGFNIAPVKYEVFDDGIYVVGVIELGSAILKKKVVGINGVSIDEVCEKIAEIIPHENDYFLKSAIPSVLRLYEILEALDVGNSNDSYQLNLEGGENILIKGSNPSAIFVSCYETNKTPLYLVNNKTNYWYQLLDNNIVYLQYSSCTNILGNSFSNFVQDMFVVLKDQSINKFIIDIRFNGGGSSILIAPLIDTLKKLVELNGKIYVCIGCKTFSSGLLNAIQLKNDLGAILVGEPTGGKPNHFGEVREFILPNSRLVVRYSIKYFTDYPDNDMNTLDPDFFVKTNSYDSFSGIDSYIEFIKSN